MIGIISFHCQYNFGSALQAWAMQEILRKLNQKTLILNYYYKEDMRTYDIRWYGKNPLVICFDLITLPQCRARKKSYQNFHNIYFHQSEMTTEWEQLGQLSAECDTIICGSDQIWNIALTGGLHPAYFLKFASNSQKKVAYAPSVSIQNIPDQYRASFADYLSSFAAISVREKQTADQLTEIIHRKVNWVADPTLLLCRNDYDRLIGDYVLKLPHKYIFMYCIHQVNKYVLQEKTEQIAEQLGAEIVYFSKLGIHKPRYLLNIFTKDPRAFLLAVKNAEYVISDSYHAGVFSIIYEKEFMTYALEDSKSRMDSLFEKVGISGRFITNNVNVSEKIDYIKVNEHLREFVDESKRYLLNALEIDDEEN